MLSFLRNALYKLTDKTIYTLFKDKEPDPKYITSLNLSVLGHIDIDRAAMEMICRYFITPKLSAWNGNRYVDPYKNNILTGPWQIKSYISHEYYGTIDIIIEIDKDKIRIMSSKIIDNELNILLHMISILYGKEYRTMRVDTHDIVSAGIKLKYTITNHTKQLTCRNCNMHLGYPKARCSLIDNGIIPVNNHTTGHRPCAGMIDSSYASRFVITHSMKPRDARHIIEFANLSGVVHG